MLIVFAGLPGTGKSTIARSLALEFGAVWLRADSIEQGVRESGVVHGSLNDAGYRAAYAVAEDNLRLGLNVLTPRHLSMKVTGCTTAANVHSRRAGRKGTALRHRGSRKAAEAAECVR